MADAASHSSRIPALGRGKRPRSYPGDAPRGAATEAGPAPDPAPHPHLDAGGPRAGERPDAPSAARRPHPLRQLRGGPRNRAAGWGEGLITRAQAVCPASPAPRHQLPAQTASALSDGARATAAPAHHGCARRRRRDPERLPRARRSMRDPGRGLSPERRATRSPRALRAQRAHVAHPGSMLAVLCARHPPPLQHRRE